MQVLHGLVILLGMSAAVLALAFTTDFTNTLICLGGAVVGCLGTGLIYRDRVYGFSKQKSVIAQELEKWK
jgi:hypothetical protein